MPLAIQKTKLSNILILTPKVFEDNRGYFTETFHADELAEVGFKKTFIQDNQSFSTNPNTLRGFHFQTPPYSQDKLIRINQGSILDIVVDIRTGSPTYGQHISVELSSENFIDKHPSALILGDNIHYGQGLFDIMKSATQKNIGATVFAYHVADPERYGVVEFDDFENVISVEKKPLNPKSNWAITGLYFYDEKVIEYAKQIKPSKRGEYEITAINDLYLRDNKLSVQRMGIGYAWFDTGTHDSLLEAANYVADLEKRQGLLIGCPEYCAYRQGYINRRQLEAIATPMINSNYGSRLLRE